MFKINCLLILVFSSTLLIAAPGPNLNSITPSGGPLAGGNTVTISGSRLSSVTSVTVYGNACSNLIVLNSNTLTCKVAAHAAGTGSVFAIDAAGKSDTLNSAYTYANTPTVNSISPSSAPQSGGDNVTITGTGFKNGASVSLNGTDCDNVNIISSSSLTCNTGNSSTSGLGNVVVTNADDQFGSKANAFTYIAAPVVVSSDPIGGAPSGGTLVTISGTAFVTGATVKFGTRTCTSVNVLSSNTLTCISPSHSSGSVTIKVINPDGQNDSLSNGYKYDYPPTFSSVSPTSGPASGNTTLTILGSDFNTGIAVTIGNLSCNSVVRISSSKLTCVTSSSTVGGLFNVTLTNTDDQFVTAANAFTYLNPPPTISSVSPNSGSTLGENTINIYGTGFLPGIGVVIGGNNCLSPVVTSNQITCTTPSHASGVVSIQVTNTDLKSATLSNAFTYINPPVLSTLTPTSGLLTGGTTITLSGSDFQSGAAIYVGDSLCTAINVVSSTQATCMTPSHAIGLVSAKITNPDSQSSTLNNSFTYKYPAPQVDSVSPSEGPASGGTLITITGTEFLSGATVLLGGTACSSVTVNSSTQLQCTTPVHANGIASVTVTNSDTQTATLTNAFNYITPPALSSVSPIKGPNQGGTLLNLQGTGFVDGIIISIGSRPCLQTIFVTNTEVTCITPAAATGTVDLSIKNPDNQTSTLSNIYTYEGSWIWKSGSKIGNAMASYGTKGVASPSNVPGARDSLITWIDSSNNLWLYGGYGFDSVGNQGGLSDLWKFDGTNWTWISGSGIADTKGFYGTKGLASTSNLPGARTNAISWKDSQDNFWILGGYGSDSTGAQGFLNDLWKYDGTNWTWISGSSTSGQAGRYGTLGLPDLSNIPGARGYSVSWTDSQDNLWLFGGYAIDSAGAMGDTNDLWKFDGANWTWMSGSYLVRQRGTYGSMGVSALVNIPGARDSAHSWIDSANNLWLFGGYGLDSMGAAGDLNDLWKFDGTYWTWISGSNMKGQKGTHGTVGNASISNIPGARDSAATWIDTSNNLWMMGGFGVDGNGTNGILNDLWKFDGTNWTWVSGSSIKNAATTNNSPGSRGYAAHWMDSSNKLWLFGGYGIDINTAGGDLNDLWVYLP